MSEQSLSSADQQIFEQQQALRQKTRNIVILVVSIIAVIGLAYVAKQSLFSDPDPELSKTTEASGDFVTLSNTEIEIYRDEFRQTLAEFEQTSQTILDNPDIANWQPKRIQALFDKKDRALSEFAKSSFKTATNTLIQLSSDAEVLEKDWQTSYQQKIDSAAEFLSQDKINQARLAFSEAVAIMPENPKGQGLAVKLDAYEQVNQVRQAFKVAQVENNLDKQIQLLEQLLTLDPSLSEEKTRLQQLISKRLDERHSQLILQANQAIDKGQLDKANQLLSQAQSLKPKNKATQTLVKRLKDTQKSNLLQTHLSEIEGLVTQQNWQAVAIKAEQYKVRHPGQQRFDELAIKAQRIMTAQKQISQLINKPERLADDNIRQVAINRMQGALSLAPESNALATQLGELAKIIDNYSIAVPVTINSDDESYILVLGVGHVGVVSQHQIELTPGTYTLEARKQGYKTKRLDIEVSEGKQNLFFIANDEKI